MCSKVVYQTVTEMMTDEKTYVSSPGTEVPVNVHTIGLELNCDITSCIRI